MQTIDPLRLSSCTAALFCRVLVPVNFTMVSHSAVFAALDFQRLFGAKVCVFNLTHKDENDQFLGGLGSPTTTGDLLGEGGAALRRFVDNIAPGQADTVEYGVEVADDYVTSICTKASSWGATLVVLSHEHSTGLLRTHAEKLVKSLAVAVLLLQPPSKE